MGKKKIPLPTAGLQKAVVFPTPQCLCRAAVGGEVPCFAEGGQGEWQWDVSAMGFSCTPWSLGIRIHDQHFAGNRTFMLHF